jgi:hypothetical protein
MAGRDGSGRGRGAVVVMRNKSTDRPVVVPEDVADKASRPYRAHKLRQQGVHWVEIAKQLEYPTVAACCAEVRNWRREATALVSEWTQQEMLKEEVDRLDALQAAVWVPAMAGDTRSVLSVLQIIKARSELLGLAAADGPVIQQAVVVTGETAAYIASLRKVADGE